MKERRVKGHTISLDVEKRQVNIKAYTDIYETTADMGLTGRECAIMGRRKGRGSSGRQQRKRSGKFHIEQLISGFFCNVREGKALLRKRQGEERAKGRDGERTDCEETERKRRRG